MGGSHPVGSNHRKPDMTRSDPTRSHPTGAGSNANSMRAWPARSHLRRMQRMWVISAVRNVGKVRNVGNVRNVGSPQCGKSPQCG